MSGRSGKGARMPKGTARAMPHQPVEQTLFRLRVRYVKRGRLAYLGHLEVIHTIERIVRRARLPFAVTQGFSPRMRAGFTSALPVGTSSTCEYYDLFLTALVGTDEALRRLRASSAEDLAPAEAGYVAVRAPALTADVTRIGYRVALEPGAGEPLDVPALARALERVRGRGSIPYIRGRKEKSLNLDRTLAGAEVSPAPGGGAVIELDTRCDNDGALRPEIVLAAIDRDLSGSERPIESTGIQDLSFADHCHVERTSQLVEGPDGTWADPLDRAARRATSESAQFSR